MLTFLLRWRARLSPARVGVVLVYHRVGGDRSGSEDLEILPAVGRSQFGAQLDHLRRHYRVVRPDDILGAVDARRRGERFPVAITFDDDLAEHVREALPALRAAGLGATFFLSGASLRESHSFWWEDLQRVFDAGLLEELPHVEADAAVGRDPRTLLELSRAITRLAPTERDEVRAALRDAAGPPPAEAGLREEDVRAIVAGGCTIGFHTLGHEVLTALTHRELDDALREGRDTLAAAAGTPVDTIAYPHGKADARVAARVRAAGFSAAFTTARGVVSPETDRHLIPRTVADLSATALARRLARLFAAA
jgi:peptidoglycan/xylan/chitin deacetylase (PgdA/CDA1 family)